MEYTLEITEPAYKPRHATSLYLITGFASVGIGSIVMIAGNASWVKSIFQTPTIQAALLGSIGLVYGIILLTVTFFRNKWLQVSRNNKIARTISFIILLGLGIAFFYSKWWLPSVLCTLIGITNLFAVFLENRAGKPLYIHFEKDEIRLPYLLRNKYLEWSEIKRVMIRYGVVTIDCKDNHLYQWNIRNPKFSIEEFELFCKKNIEKTSVQEGKKS